MEDIRYQKQLPDYRPNRRRRSGRLLNTLLEGNKREAETGCLLAGLHDQKRREKTDSIRTCRAL